MSRSSLIAVWLAIACGTAHAAPVGVVATAPDHAPVPAPDARQAVARAARAAGAQVEIEPFAVARARLASGAVPAAVVERFAQARDLGRQGWNAYLAADMDKARADLERALGVAESVLHVDGGLVVYADLSLRLGAVLLKLGQAERAMEALRLARSLDPEREVSIAAFAPDVVQAYQAAAAGQTGVLEVTAEPPGARIEIDGRRDRGQDRGAAPLAVEVAAGRHVIVARAPGHASRGQVVRVTAATQASDDEATPTQVTITLERDAEAAALARGAAWLAPGRSPADTAAALTGLVRYGELDSAVLVASVWRGSSPALLGQRCSGVPLRCTDIVEVRYPRPGNVESAAVELWSGLESGRAELGQAPELLADARVARADRPQPAQHEQKTGHTAETPAGTPAQQPGCAWCRNRWLWLGVGAAALATGATVWMLRDSRTTPVITLDPCEFGGCP